MKKQALRVSIFIGGPGDVTDEKNILVKHIRETLQKKYNELKLEPFTYDDQIDPISFSINKEPQEIVNQKIDSKDCDIVIMIFKWRMGSPVNIKGKEYLSGSHYELVEALESEPKPIVGIFKYTEDYGDPIPSARTVEEFEIYKKKIDEEKKQYKTLLNLFQEIDEKHKIRKKINLYRNRDHFLAQADNLIKDGLEEILKKNDKPIKAVKLRAEFAGYPFRGLSTFKFNDSDIYFGRSREINELISRIKENRTQRFLCIYGDSGTGKSSFLHAGLLPNLVKTDFFNGDNDWRVLYFSPGEFSNDPFVSFETAVLRMDYKHGLLDFRRGELEDALKKSFCDNFSLEKKDHYLYLENLFINKLLALSSSSSSKLIVTIDQLEELFTVTDSILRDGFLALIATMIQSERILVLCTLRSDLFKEFSNFTKIASILNQQANALYKLLPPDRDQLEEMIVGPAKVAGIAIEKKLITQILNDAGDSEGGALPLVSYCLQSLRIKHDDELTVEAYDNIGNLTGSIRKLADKATEKLSQPELEFLFESIVFFENGTPARRLVPLSDIKKSEVFIELIDSLDRYRLIHFSSIDDKPAIQLGHEILFSSWPALEEWIGKSEGRLRLLDEVENDAKLWDESGRRRWNIKLHNEKLEEVKSIFKENPKRIKNSKYLTEYIKAAEEQRQRKILIHSINGGRITGIVNALKSGAKLEVEDRGDEPGQVLPQFWAAVTGDDRSDNDIIDQDSSGLKSYPSIYEDKDLLNSRVTRGWTPMHLAALCGHLDLVKKIAGIQKDAVYALSEGEANTLSMAAFGGHLDIVKYLYEEHGVAPNATEKDGSSAVLWAYQQDQKKVVDYLRSLGASLNLKMKGGWNSLTEAVRSGDIENVKVELQKGISVNYQTEHGLTPFLIACQYGHCDIASYLVLEEKADRYITDKYGRGGFHFAVFGDNTEIIKMLLDIKLDINLKDDNLVTPLHHASNFGKIEFIKILLTHNAKFDIADVNNFYPIHSATAAGYDRIIQLLIDHNDDPNRKGQYNWSPLHFCANDGDIKTSKVLIQAKGIDLDSLEEVGWTPLMIAVRKGHIEEIKLLLKHGADPEYSTARTTALDVAVDNHQYEAIKVLIENFDFSEETLTRALISSINSKNTRILSLLLSVKPNVFAADLQQKIPFMEALTIQDVEILKMFFGCIEDPSRLPLVNYVNYAIKVNNLDLLKYFLELGADVTELDESNYYSPIFSSIALDRVECAKMLVDHNNDLLDSIDAYLHTPMEYAVHYNKEPFINLFRTYGMVEPTQKNFGKYSSRATFLKFEPAEEQDLNMLSQGFNRLSNKGAILFDINNVDIYSTKLNCMYETSLIAVEDKLSKRTREQFFLYGPDKGISALDWTNEPIYNWIDQYGLKVDEDDNAILYAKFFFFWVRGSQGDFKLIETLDDISWDNNVSVEYKEKIHSYIKPMIVIERDLNKIILQGTVLFRDALFYSKVFLAKTHYYRRVEEQNDHLKPGQLELFDEELLVEDMPVNTEYRPYDYFGY